VRNVSDRSPTIPVQGTGPWNSLKPKTPRSSLATTSVAPSMKDPIRLMPRQYQTLVNVDVPGLFVSSRPRPPPNQPTTNVARRQVSDSICIYSRFLTHQQTIHNTPTCTRHSPMKALLRMQKRNSVSMLQTATPAPLSTFSDSPRQNKRLKWGLRGARLRYVLYSIRETIDVFTYSITLDHLATVHPTRDQWRVVAKCGNWQATWISGVDPI
jgi:hypothetical protein